MWTERERTELLNAVDRLVMATEELTTQTRRVADQQLAPEVDQEINNRNSPRFENGEWVDRG